MSAQILESFIRQKIETHQAPIVNFAWQGGEPTLLGVDFFRKAVKLQKKYANGKKIENSFQTNGILLNDEWCLFFKENDFLIGISMDGPEDIHNTYRLNKGGIGTFKQVMGGIEYLKKHQVEFNTLTVIQRENSYKPLDIYRFLKEAGSGFIQFIPIVERIAINDKTSHLKLASPNADSAKLTDWSVEAEQYGNFLIKIFDEWVRNDVSRYFVQIFDIALEAWLGMEPSLCVFRRTCGDALAIEHNGDLYSCDHYVYPENRLGNIMEQPLKSLLLSAQQKKFGQDKLDRLPQYCRDCEVRFVCNGECPKQRFMKTPKGENGLNYLCVGYQKFFKYIDPYMKFMANELRNQRPPANVIHWAREKDTGFASFKVGANEPCPCGSGKKYKRCCGSAAPKIIEQRSFYWEDNP